MVRGNWQRRVELNESRRHEAKQKKQRQEVKKMYKTQAQEFMTLLDQPNVQKSLQKGSNSNHNHKNTIHIWTDTIPSEAPPIWLEMLGGAEDGDNAAILTNSTPPSSKRSNGKQRGGSGGGGGRNRSASIENEAAATSSKKKAHPRSKEATMELEDPSAMVLGGATDFPKLCRSQFFGGKCLSSSSSTKGGGNGNRRRSSSIGGCCHFVHYPKQVRTLHDALKDGDGCELETTMACEQVWLAAASSSNPSSGEVVANEEGMDLLYYVGLETENIMINNDKRPSESIAEALSKRGCGGIANIVYFVWDNRLLYDRYQQGLMVQERDLTSGVDQRRSADGDAVRVVSDLPASILEHVLLFLEDRAVASTSKVCKAWNQEIGRHSGYLWKNLLQRRSWPVPSLTTNDVGSSDSNPAVERSIFRHAFVSHYGAMRDTAAIQAGVGGILNRKPMDDREGCFRLFESVRGSPHHGNVSVAIKIWSPNRVLVAYQHDCALRLFDSVERSGNGGHRICRELVLDRWIHIKIQRNVTAFC